MHNGSQESAPLLPSPSGITGTMAASRARWSFAQRTAFRRSCRAAASLSLNLTIFSDGSRRFNRMFIVRLARVSGKAPMAATTLGHHVEKFCTSCCFPTHRST